MLHGSEYWYADAAKVVPVPTKIGCLSGIFIKHVALGSEHSVAVTGLELKRQTLFLMIVSNCFLLIWKC